MSILLNLMSKIISKLVVYLLINVAVDPHMIFSPGNYYLSYLLSLKVISIAIIIIDKAFTKQTYLNLCILQFVCNILALRSHRLGCRLG